MIRSITNVRRSNLLLLLVAFLITFTACEGPAGSQGPQGPQGEVGPVGPAGEDGSTMWAGPGTPAEDVGEEGDYYLNSTTGEYYGPKDTDGWGNPIIILMGEDGQDGADGQDGVNGQDGADGEDGSRIYSGTGAPDASLGQEGDYYLDKSNFDLYGPKTGSGWGSPINIKGADGNANVTRYIFPGYDFSSSDFHRLSLSGLTESEMINSAWLAYFLKDQGSTTIYYSMPGKGTSRNYSMTRNYFSSRVLFQFTRESSSAGAEYDRIEIVRIEASNTDDRTSVKHSTIPNKLDTSDYRRVAQYYGFGNINR